MSKTNLLLGLVALLVAIVAGVLFLQEMKQTVDQDQETLDQEPDDPSLPSVPSIIYDNASSDLVVLNELEVGEEVTSPLTISGFARGYWFFEASFPVELVDAEGNVLVNSYATAQGEWMTEDMVAFSATFNFVAPEEDIEGTLILRRDNPSALPENDASVSVPVMIKGE